MSQEFSNMNIYDTYELMKCLSLKKKLQSPIIEAMFQERILKDVNLVLPKISEGSVEILMRYIFCVKLQNNFSRKDEVLTLAFDKLADISSSVNPKDFYFHL